MSMSIFLKRRGLCLGLLALLGLGGPSLTWAAGLSLGLEDAVSAALATSPSIEGASWDLLAARAKAEEAELKRYPSLDLSASYQRLSELPSGSFMGFSLPAGLTNIYSFGANLKYPVFSGFRLEEAAKLAKVLARGKEVSLEIVKRSLIFEVERAYWEAVRASGNVKILAKNLELAKSSLDLTENQAVHGAATVADRLAAQNRYAQAQLDLGDASALQRRAFLSLDSLCGGRFASGLVAAPETVSLSTAPEAPLPARLGGGPASPLSDPATLPEAQKLIELALASRPETRAQALATEAARRSLALARGALYPNVLVTGNFTLADPNQRVAFQSDPSLFTGTWALGLALSYDLGGVPANLQEIKAQEAALGRSAADEARQRSSVALDVRSCALAYEQAGTDLGILKGMIDQSREDERVATQRLQAGTASELDLLCAQISVLRADFTVTNKEIDFQEARADLARALAAVGLD